MKPGFNTAAVVIGLEECQISSLTLLVHGKMCRLEKTWQGVRTWLAFHKVLLSTCTHGLKLKNLDYSWQIR